MSGKMFCLLGFLWKDNETAIVIDHMILNTGCVIQVGLTGSQAVLCDKPMVGTPGIVFRCPWLESQGNPKSVGRGDMSSTMMPAGA